MTESRPKIREHSVNPGIDPTPGWVPPTVRRFVALFAFALVAAACGDSGSTATTLQTLDSSSSETMPPETAPASQQSPDQPLPDSDYPDVVVADLASGGDFHLKELALEQNPVLLWFWAPH